jgi:hypothetical protein
MQLNVQVRIKPFMVQISGVFLLLKWDFIQCAGFSQMIKVSCKTTFRQLIVTKFQRKGIVS